jgi:2-succinyl-5-enolpyruvyl-6-hydroxy-3-cyclohexene-1-carboxylate synthase
MKDIAEVNQFMAKTVRPLVVVSTIFPSDKESVINFLLKLNVPVYLEGISGIREEPRLKHLTITYVHKLWELSRNAGYPIDGILRIGGIPTFRPWRDLEDKPNEIPVCSISHLPFTGLSWGGVVHVNLSEFLPKLKLSWVFNLDSCQTWIESDRVCQRELMELMKEEPFAEPSLLYQLSNSIPEKSLVYLGNSLPIREWDLAAAYQNRKLDVFASRGQNGIDGQISTFLGMATPKRSNWGIFGDLTMLYDFPGPWVLNQMKDTKVNLVVINNQGGKIFSRMFPYKEIQNCHSLHFEHFAKHWGLEYYCGDSVPKNFSVNVNRFYELIPNEAATDRFWKKYNLLSEEILVSV